MGVIETIVVSVLLSAVFSVVVVLWYKNCIEKTVGQLNGVTYEEINILSEKLREIEKFHEKRDSGNYFLDTMLTENENTCPQLKSAEERIADLRNKLFLLMEHLGLGCEYVPQGNKIVEIKDEPEESED